MSKRDTGGPWCVAYKKQNGDWAWVKDVLSQGEARAQAQMMGVRYRALPMGSIVPLNRRIQSARIRKERGQP